MIKKDITFFNYADPPVEVTKTFYFNYTKLEGMEIELTYGDLEETMKELQETEDAQKAYRIFKEILVGAVGVKVNDEQFDKSEAARSAFVNSPAMSTLVWSFVEDPESAGPFLEGMLPADEVAKGRMRIEREKLEAALEAQKEPKDRQKPAQLETAAPVLDTEDIVQITKTDSEILNSPVEELNNDELARLLELRKQQS